MAHRISLVVTVFNRAKFVGQTIDSILAQTRKDWELVIWDDGSTDESPRIIAEYAKRDPRIRVITSPTNQGFTIALKSAIAETSGEFLGWIDSDDMLAPETLAETAAVLESDPKVGMVYTNYVVMDEAGRMCGPGSRTKVPYSKDRLLLDFMTFHFRLIRRSVFDQVGGIDESFKRAQDYDLCLRLSEVTQIQHLPKPLFYYRVHNTNISQQHRVEQILASHEAIKRALKRRGLEDRYEINLQIEGRFTLIKKR